MNVTTQNSFEDMEIEKTLGLVRGSTIRTKNIGYDIIASLRTIVGRITSYNVCYTKLLRSVALENEGMCSFNPLNYDYETYGHALHEIMHENT